MAEPAKAPDGEALQMREALRKWEDEAARMVAESGGDARAVIIGLLIETDRLGHDLAFARAAMPSGFARGWFQRQGRKPS
jgi:hypothetical protein